MFESDKESKSYEPKLGKNIDRPVFFHIGLPKTGTTFLQNEVFPKWDGISYIDERGREGVLKSLLLNDSDRPILISKEWMCKTVILENMSIYFPKSYIILGLRKHYSRILSSYNQQIVGIPASCLSFEEYFDVNKRGHRERENLIYQDRIDSIKKLFNCEPFIFLQEELSDNLEGLLKDLQSFIGGKAPAISNIKREQVNISYGYYQLQVLRMLNRLFTSPRGSSGILPYNAITWRIRQILIKVLRGVVPSGKKISVVKENHRQAIEDCYSDDWNFTLNYIENSKFRNNFKKEKYL